MSLSKLWDGEGQWSLACCSPWVTKSQTWLSYWTATYNNTNTKNDLMTDEITRIIFKTILVSDKSQIQKDIYSIFSLYRALKEATLIYRDKELILPWMERTPTVIDVYILYLDCGDSYLGVCMLRCFSFVWLFVSPWTIIYQTRLLCPCDFPGKNTGVGCHAFLQGTFLTQESNTCLWHFLCWRQIFFLTAECMFSVSSFVCTTKIDLFNCVAVHSNLYSSKRV